MPGLQLPSKPSYIPERLILIIRNRGAALSRMSNEANVTSFSATRHYGTKCLSPYDEIEDKGRPVQERLDDAIVTEKVGIFAKTNLALLIRT